jgi:rSAM/selenodomain-associated transferase 1
MLVVAKAPVPGRVKTRLGADIGDRAAAEVAAASLLDTLAACTAAVGAGLCHLALDGDLADAVRGPEIDHALEGWSTSRQRGDGLAARLVRAHLDVPGPGPVVQIGMDTPQVTPDLLRAAADGTDENDAVLGPAEDGGWWVLAVRDARSAEALTGIPMSTPTTYEDTRAALREAGLTVGTTTTLRDVDTVADARTVAVSAPGGHFARTWREVGSRP